MTISNFTYLLQEPQKITLEQIQELQQIIEEYPYFQAPKALYLKGLKNLDSFKYNNTLKHTAAYTTSRDVLFNFITSDAFNQHHIANTITKQSNQKEITDNSTLFNIDIKEAEKILSPEFFSPKKQEYTEREDIEEQLQIGKPLDFNKNELHSFAEWLQITLVKPIDRTKEKSQNTNSEIHQKYKLIDQFIENNPKIIPSKTVVSNINLAEQVPINKSRLMTETLAKVYLEQKKYKDAIQAYKILSLKYPEKSGFFADQIRAIEKLQ